MNISKHTPGPWEHDAAHKRGLGSTEVCIDTTVRPTGPIALVYPVEGIEADERLANIRLIAAAPEMYQKLRWILSIAHPGSALFLDTKALLARIDGEE